MYLFWWHKPLLPNEPIILRDESLAPLVAFMYSSSEMSGYMDPERVKSQTLIKTLFAQLNLYSRTPELETLRLLVPRRNRQSAQEPPHEQILPQGAVQRAPEACLTKTEESRQKDAASAFFERRPRILQQQQPPSTYSSSSERKRHEMMEQALQQYPALMSKDRILLTHQEDPGLPSTMRAQGPKHDCLHLRPEQLVANHIQNWPSNDLLRNVDGLIVGMILWLANLCYGGFHAAAWNEHFASPTERWAWRASASYIAFCGALWIILNSAVARWSALNSFWEKWMDGKKSLLQSFGLGAVVFVCGSSLCLARAFIVVEAFMSIRELPMTAYATPEWSDVFPHF